MLRTGISRSNVAPVPRKTLKLKIKDRLVSNFPSERGYPSAVIRPVALLEWILSSALECDALGKCRVEGNWNVNYPKSYRWSEVAVWSGRRLKMADGELRAHARFSHCIFRGKFLHRSVALAGEIFRTGASETGIVCHFALAHFLRWRASFGNNDVKAKLHLRAN